MGDELHLTLAWVAAAVGGDIKSGDPGMEIGNIVTDTRVVQGGDFLVALRGARYDAHDFVRDALVRGAAGALVRRGFDTGAEGGSAGLVAVDDTTTALQALAHAIRRASGTRVVAITGSAGKTTTKEVIARFLGSQFRVVKNKGNLNNQIGLPLSLLQLRERPDAAVMELGMNHPGEISVLVAIAEPEVRVWTNVGDAHIGFFPSVDAIADAKAEILEGAAPSHVLVANADDQRVMSRADRFAGRVVTFGTSDRADVRARDIEDLGIGGMRAHVVTRAGEKTIETPLLGRGNLDNLLAGAAVALEFDVPLDAIGRLAPTLKPAERRGAVHRLRDGVVLIDDSYNSSPEALRRALGVVAHESGAQRKVAVLGEMLELGDQAIPLHQESGRRSVAAGVEWLVVIGGAAARAMADAALAAGMPAAAVAYFEESQSAAIAVAEAVRPGDLVLVKGSRGTRVDVVSDRIVAEFS